MEITRVIRAGLLLKIDYAILLDVVRSIVKPNEEHAQAARMIQEVASFDKEYLVNNAFWGEDSAIRKAGVNYKHPQNNTKNKIGPRRPRGRPRKVSAAAVSSRTTAPTTVPLPLVDDDNSNNNGDTTTMMEANNTKEADVAVDATRNTTASQPEGYAAPIDEALQQEGDEGLVLVAWQRTENEDTWARVVDHICRPHPKTVFLYETFESYLVPLLGLSHFNLSERPLELPSEALSFCRRQFYHLADRLQARYPGSTNPPRVISTFINRFRRLIDPSDVLLFLEFLYNRSCENFQIVD